MSQQTMSQTEFAKHYGVSQPMVFKYLQQGKIPETCLIQVGKYRRIIVECAVKSLEQNLDRIYNPVHAGGRNTEEIEELDVFEGLDVSATQEMLDYLKG